MNRCQKTNPEEHQCVREEGHDGVHMAWAGQGAWWDTTPPIEVAVLSGER